MTNHFFGRWKILAGLLLPLMVSLACTLATGTEAPHAKEQSELVLGPGTFYLPDPRVGLAQLSSYKETLTVTFDGTQAGQPQGWSTTYLMLHTNEAPADLVTIESTGDIPAADPVLIAEVEGAAYQVREDGKCRVKAIDPQYSLMAWFEPAGQLNGLLGAEEAGQETLNGVAADHYTFDERALTLYGIAESTGEIWVAADGGYLLKYLRTTTGRAEYFGEGIEGRMSWEYALTEINRPVDIQLPAGCPPGLVAAPRMADASNVRDVPGWLSYNTTSSVADAAAFYRKELPRLGWAPAPASAVGDTGAFLEFSQGNRTMDVIITTGEAGTEVSIVVTAPEE
jgi:hypothetical protein